MTVGRARLLWLLLPLTAVLCASGAGALEEYVPPEGGPPWMLGKVYLLATGEAPEARGAAAILWTQDGVHHRLQLYAKQLQPGAQYSVWLLRSAEDLNEPGVDERFRVPTGRVRLIADRDGVLAFATNLTFAVRDGFAAIVLRRDTEASRGGWSGGINVLCGLIADID